MLCIRLDTWSYLPSCVCKCCPQTVWRALIQFHVFIIMHQLRPRQQFGRLERLLSHCSTLSTVCPLVCITGSSDSEGKGEETERFTGGENLKVSLTPQATIQGSFQLNS